MCKTKMATNVSEPSRTPRALRNPPPNQTHSSSSAALSGYNSTSSGTKQRSHSSASSGGASVSRASRASLSSVRESLPENPHIYDVAEIRSATNNFLSRRLSSSSSNTTAASWRCSLRGKETVIFQRKFRRKIDMPELKERLSVICRSHHGSIVNLLGASITASGGDHIYLVYEYIKGATLSDCLRNPRNPNFTVLSTWISRIRVATDLAHGLDYIHNKTGLKIRNLVHNHIKSSSVIIVEPSLNAKICHFGTAQLCGETDELDEEEKEGDKRNLNPIKRSDSRELRFEGVRGYMSPEFMVTGIATKKSDIYAFGVVMLELISGEEPLRYRYDGQSGDFVRTSVIETARVALEGGGGGGERVRRWVDRRLKDSFPVTVVEKMMSLALECVAEDPERRPEMGRVAGKISKMYLESEKWAEVMKKPAEISVSLAPR